VSHDRIEAPTPRDSVLPPPEGSPHTLRMKDLCERTGLPRQAIHFYIQQGLLPPGKKTGRNMAFYGEEHVTRVLLVRKLQHERFLPLRAIKALLEGHDGHFSPAQRALLSDVKQRFTTSQLAKSDALPELTLSADEACARTGVPRADLDRAVEIGVLGAREVEGTTLIAQEDLWMLEAWAEIRRLGYADELGFRIDDLTLLQEVVDGLFQREALLLASRIERMSPERAAAMIERALPIVHQFVTGLHVKRIRSFFSTLE
jgi:DNA-binding transcriptional MerR regulator